MKSVLKVDDNCKPVFIKNAPGESDGKKEVFEVDIGCARALGFA